MFPTDDKNSGRWKSATILIDWNLKGFSGQQWRGTSLWTVRATTYTADRVVKLLYWDIIKVRLPPFTVSETDVLYHALQLTAPSGISETRQLMQTLFILIFFNWLLLEICFKFGVLHGGVHTSSHPFTLTSHITGVNQDRKSTRLNSSHIQN